MNKQSTLQEESTEPSEPRTCSGQGEDTQLDLVWGAELIGAELNISTRTAFYLLERGEIPAQKIGRRWCTTRGALRRRFGVV